MTIAPPADERRRAAELLRRIEQGGLYATPLLAGETGLIRTLVLGVLRWRSRLDFIIDRLAEQRQLDDDTRDLLRIGIYQIMFTSIPRYAAVSETVSMAPVRSRGYVNALLRRAADSDLLAFGRNDLSVQTAHPRWLIERWSRLYGEERTRRILEADQELSSPDILVTGEPPDGVQPSAVVPHIYRVAAGPVPAGFYAMDEGSAVVAAIAAAAGGKLLDLTAAPGSKSRYLEAQGVAVTANDVSLSRLRPLIGSARRLVVSDGRMSAFRERSFDTVLLDAPCSATGTLRKNPELKWRLREETPRERSQLQKSLLAAAATLTRRMLIYATCSLEPEENDEVIASCPQLETIDVTPLAPAGARPWVQDGVLRLTPESGADGFTAFALVRRQ